MASLAKRISNQQELIKQRRSDLPSYGEGDATYTADLAELQRLERLEREIMNILM